MNKQEYDSRHRRLLERLQDAEAIRDKARLDIDVDETLINAYDEAVTAAQRELEELEKGTEHKRRILTGTRGGKLRPAVPVSRRGTGRPTRR